MTKRAKHSVVSPTRAPIPPIPALVQARTELEGPRALALPKVPGRASVLKPHSAQIKPVQAILDGGKSLGGTLYSGSDTSRRERRAEARAAAQISMADRVAA